MIAAWMLFVIELSGLLFVSAWIAERALRLLRRPVRGVWVVALAGANLLPLVLAKVPSVAAVTDGWTLAVAPDSVFARLSSSLLVMWCAAAAIGVFICLSAIWRMARTRTEWKSEHVDNSPVLVSHDVGPALVGVMQYSIVFPQWAHTLDHGARTLLLAHEREHARKYDPLLLTIAALAVVAAPWNVFNWLFFRRLHLAVELDCDQRVLRTHPDTRRYGALLLDVAERVLPSVMPAAAFVEHGSSLETRIDAMSNKTKSFQMLRVASGLGLSSMFALAACFTPRPYAIVIVNPPAPSAGAPAAPASVQVVPLTSQALSNLVQTAPVKQESRVAVQSPAVAINDAEIRPVPPSARVRALDEAETERMRSVVVKYAPRALGNFGRSDTALVLLLSDNGTVLRQSGISLAVAGEGADPMHVFSKIFIQPDINGIGSASRFTIDRGADNEPLRTPLTLYTAYQTRGVPTARMRVDLTPSPADVMAVVRARYPNALTERTQGSSVIMMLFDTKGGLLKSASVAVDSLASPPDGNDDGPWRRVFGVFMDSGSVIDRGSMLQADANLRQGRPLSMIFGTMLMRSEYAAFERLLEGKRRNWTFGGFSSRKGSGGYDTDAMSARLRLMIHTRVPDAYGDWSRSDSAVLLLFDANNQLIARKAGPIPEAHGIEPLADYISLRALSFPPADIDAVGWTNLLSSESGRILDKPLVVVWGRLSGEATRKRELTRLQNR